MTKNNNKKTNKKSDKTEVNIDKLLDSENKEVNEQDQLSIHVSELKGKKLFVATPCYGGMCNGLYAKSMMDLAITCTQFGVELSTFFLFNESLITRARAYAVDAFIRSNADHLLFIDSDISFNPKDVLMLLGLQARYDEYDIIGGPYPKKNVSYEKIKDAVDKGYGDDDPSQLENFMGDFVLNPIDNGITSHRLDRPIEVAEIGTGFMMIKREVFTAFRDAHPEMMYKPDHARSDHFDGSREILMCFQAEIDPKTRRYLSEDYYFCQKVREIGKRVWICPWVMLDHCGSFVYKGNLAALAAIGASATVDPSKLKKNKQ